MKANAFRVLCVIVAALLCAAPLRAACSVSCTATVPSTATAGASVSFQSTATPCDCTGATTYAWTFGDGNTSTSASPSHAYASNGTYNWQLTVTSESATCTKSGSITVGPVTPAAGTYSGTTSAGRPFSITVNGSAQITAWTVGFQNLCGGTGTTTTSGATCAVTNGTFTCGTANCSPFSTQNSITGTFTSPTAVSGTATLKSMPGTSTCCTQTPTFSAARAVLTAAASSDVSSGTAPLLVNFTGSATGGTAPYTYHWDFGDCATSNTQNPSHTYAAGNWTAVLTVADSTSATDDATVNISALAAGITVTPTTGLTTSESGTDATFTVVLNTQPDANVTIELHPSDTTEALLSTDAVTEQSSITLTFTSANWNTPQTVTVHGQNDALDDGNIAYTVVTSPADSTDTDYDNLDAADVSATNDDDDVAAVTVTPTTLEVSETGTLDTFSVVLTTQPTGNVVIDVASTDTGEVTVAPAQLTFTSGDWSTPKIVTATGVDDAALDDDQVTTVTVTMNAAATADAIYDAIDPADVSVTTVDDDIFTIVSTNPLNATNTAPRDGNLVANTSHMLDTPTVTQSSFRVQGAQTGRINGTYGAINNSFHLDPTNLLKPGEQIRATATAAIENTANTPLRPHVWQFRAAAGIGSGAMMVHPTAPPFVAGSSVAVALGDVDGDGDLDAVFGNDHVSDVPQAETVWANDGTGVFTLLSSFGANRTYGIVLGDLDNDGDLDAVSVNNGGDEPEKVWLNNGSGVFTAHPTTPSLPGGGSYDAALGDLDGDGDLDLVVANGAGSEANRVWVNDGTGSFSAHPTTPAFDTATSSYAVDLGDIDGDGDLDAVIGNGLHQPDSVWLNDGAGNLTPHPTTPTFGTSWTFDLELGDVDGDGDLDVVTANYNNPSKETVWLNDGDGNYTPHPTTPQFGSSSWDVELGDVDGDGDLDALVAEPGTLFLNDGAGNFAPHAINGFSAGGGIDGALGDLDGDGDLDSLITTSPSGPELVSLNTRLVVTPSQGRVTTESGGTSTFAIVLGKQPANDVEIQLASSDTSEGLISIDGVNAFPSLLFTFTSANWSTPRTITIHGQNDAILDGDVAYTIDVELSTSDPFYSGVVPLDVSVTNLDNERVDVSTTAVTVAESGTTATFTIVLGSQPSGNVVIDVASMDTSEATVSPAQLTFTSANWNTPQTVTVTGVDDVLDDGDQVTVINITMNGATADATYASVDPPNVDATTTDDDAFRIVSTNPATSENAAPRSANVQATANANINAATVTQSTFRVQGEQTGGIAGAYSASGTSMQLDPTSDFKPGEVIRATATSGIQSTTAIAILPHVWQFTAATALASGAFVPHPVKPNFPAFGTSVHPALGDLDGDGDLDAIFANTADTWETVWLNDGGGVFTQLGTFGGGDTYDVALGDLDGDGDLDAVCANRLSDETVWLNDGSGAFTQHGTTFNADWTMDVVLGDIDGDGDLDALLAGQSVAPTAWVNDGSGGFTAHPTTPTFGGLGANAIALGDLDGDGDLDAFLGKAGTENICLNDGNGNFATASTAGSDDGFDVALGDLDNDGDLDAVVVNRNGVAEKVWLNNGSGTFSSHSSFGTGDSHAVALGDIDGDGDLDAVVANAGTEAETVWVNDGSANFTAHPRFATLNAGTETWGLSLGDLDADGDLDLVIANAGNPHQDETVWLNQRIVVMPGSGLVTTEAGGTATFDVSLGRAPSANVTINVATSNSAEGRLNGAMTNVTLTFTPANWMTPQTVTLHGQNDAVDDGDVAYTIITNAAASADAFFNGVNVHDVTATNTDDDTAGVTRTPASVTVGELGTTATFTVVLNTKPTSNVTIMLESSRTSEATVSPLQLTFTDANWLTPQTVTVTGVNDNVDDNDQMSTIALTINTAATADAQYDAVDPPDVTVTTTDNDTAGFLVVQTGSTTVVSETGTSDTFTVRPITEPTGDVVVDVASLDGTEATVGPSQLTFTSANWMTPQTVTVTGVDDALDDGNQIATIALTMSGATGDAVYATQNPPDVAATVLDDDKTVTTTTVTSSLNPSLSGQSVTFTATVSGGTGTVTFFDGALAMGTVALTGNTATFTTSTLAVGGHSITAQYNGDASFFASTSSAVAQTVNASPFGAPPFVTARATSTTQVTITWGAVSGATGYEVYRSSAINAPFVFIGSASSTALTNSGLSANTTYLYRVRALSSGGPSPDSAIDAATTVIFTDTVPLTIKTLHVTELRTAVNAMRAAANLAAFVFTDPSLTGLFVKRLHIIELRTALDAARAAIGLPALTYTDPAITAATTKVKAVHVTELRSGTQ